MTRSLKRCLIPLMAVLASVSCIYDAPGDRFYRTLWISDENSLEPLPSDGIMLEFLCGQSVSIKTGHNQILSYGTYDSSDMNAVFRNLTLHIGGVSAIFIDADRNGDSLILRWRLGDSPDTYSIRMHRLSAYPAWSSDSE